MSVLVVMVVCMCVIFCCSLFQWQFSWLFLFYGHVFKSNRCGRMLMHLFV